MKPGVFPASWKLSTQVALIWSTACQPPPVVRDDVVRAQDQDHPGELDLRDGLRGVEVAVSGS